MFLLAHNSPFFMIRRCSRYTSRTASGIAALLPSALLHLLQGLQARHLLLAEDLLLLPAFPNPSVKGLVLHPAKARETRQCIVVTSLQLLDLASQSVQLDDVCLQAVPLLLHELNCSCHRNSCPELTFLSSLSCKFCLRSRRR